MKNGSCAQQYADKPFCFILYSTLFVPERTTKKLGQTTDNNHSSKQSTSY